MPLSLAERLSYLPGQANIDWYLRAPHALQAARCSQALLPIPRPCPCCSASPSSKPSLVHDVLLFLLLVLALSMEFLSSII